MNFCYLSAVFISKHLHENFCLLLLLFIFAESTFLLIILKINEDITQKNQTNFFGNKMYCFDLVFDWLFAILHCKRVGNGFKGE